MRDYNAIRDRETGMQWGNVGTLVVGAVMVGSFFVPGGPVIATLLGAGLGMAPGIINGVTTGNWDAGSIIKGAVVGGVAGRLGLASGRAGNMLGRALLRSAPVRRISDKLDPAVIRATSIASGGAGGAATGSVGEIYDVLPLPGSDGQFNVETVTVDAAIGAATAGMYRAYQQSLVARFRASYTTRERLGNPALRTEPLTHVCHARTARTGARPA